MTTGQSQYEGPLSFLAKLSLHARWSPQASGFIMKKIILASTIYSIGLFAKEMKKGPDFEVVYRCKNTNFSFTAGTSKMSHWDKYHTSQYLREHRVCW